MISSLFQHENELWQRGYIVIGVDEAGRGAFAGPIVAASCAFSSEIVKNISMDVIVNDSKLLSSKQREHAFLWIKKHCLKYSISMVGVTTINKIGIAKANIIALRRVTVQLINQLNRQKIFVLSDYYHIPSLLSIRKNCQRAIIHGDRLSFSIAAASIIAKVARDRLMKKLAENYHHYHWHQNKGYGTLQHRQAIKKFGKTALHRELFIRNYL